ncbi:hypothetical protein Tco_0018526 [Tanacetum coccineum]
MVPFFLNDLGFTLELRSPSNFMTTGLIQPCQTLCKMFARSLTTRATGHDQLPLQITHMLYCFVNNVHVDYVEFLWEGLHYSLEHPSTLIPYPRFIKLIVGHYMTAYPEISKRTRDKYHNLENDDIFKSIFNSGKRKKLVEGTDKVDADEFVNSILNSQNDHGTRHLKTASMPRKHFDELAKHLKEIMNESLTSMVYSRVNEATKTIVPVYVAKGLLMEKPRMQAEVAQMVADAI